MTIQKLSDLDAHMGEQAVREAYRLCETENSNLRKILLWSAQFLTVTQRRDLRDKLKPSIEDGGVTGDHIEDEAEITQHAIDAVNALDVHVQALLDSPSDAVTSQLWYAQADALLGKVRELMPDKNPLASLGEIRNLGDHHG